MGKEAYRELEMPPTLGTMCFLDVLEKSQYNSFELRSKRGLELLPWGVMGFWMENV